MSGAGLLCVTHVLEAIPNNSHLRRKPHLLLYFCIDTLKHLKVCKHTYPLVAFRNPVAPESWGQSSSSVSAVGKLKKDF